MIDASIPLNPNRPVKQPGIATLGQLVALRGAEQETQRRQMELEDMQAARTDQAKRDQAFSALLQSGEAFKNPEAVFTVAGPERAKVFYDGLTAFQRLQQGQQQDRDKSLLAVLRTIEVMPASEQQKGWDFAFQGLKQAGVIQDRPELAQFDPAKLKILIAQLGGEPAKAPTLIQRDPTRDLVDPQTGRVVSPGTPKTEADKPIYRLSPDKSKLEEVGRVPAGAQVVAEPAPPRPPAPDVLAEMPNEFRRVAENAIALVPSIRRGSAVNELARRWKAGDEDGVKEYIRRLAFESENVDQKNQIRGRQATIASLQTAGKLLDEMEAAGVKTNWLTGTIEDQIRKVGMTTDPSFVRFKQRMMNALIQYRRAATGVQFSERESADYARMFPNYKNTMPVNKAQIEGLVDEMVDYDRVFWEGKLGPSGAALVGAVSAKAAGAKDPLGIR